MSVTTGVILFTLQVAGTEVTLFDTHVTPNVRTFAVDDCSMVMSSDPCGRSLVMKSVDRATPWKQVHDTLTGVVLLASTALGVHEITGLS